MVRAIGIAVFLGAATLAGPAGAGAEGSVLDQLDVDSARVFALEPDLVRFTTIGSPEGARYASLADELSAAIVRAKAMASDANAGWATLIQIRVITTSEADRAEAAGIFAADPELAALPVSWRVVDRLPAREARIGLDLVAVRRPAGA